MLEILKIISFIFLIVGIFLIFTGMIEVVYLKDYIPFIPQRWKGTLGVLCFVIASSLYKISKINRLKQT
ncbi:hypothetical protein ACQKII_16400 [Lysinibacillus sp. NPDC048646]|uniref:hypothetical protein n=1 Tax=Lysinibacillus sp. NPDC048646 TaxID=3390574 RepID=UPI003D06BA12